MKFTSLLEEAHFNMIRRLLFSSILATQFIAFSAIVRDDAFRGSDLRSGDGRGSLTAALLADDPVPCPDCGPPPGLVSLSGMLADDPVPCPDCDPPPGLVSLSGMLADDPVPCPDCDPPPGPALPSGVLAGGP